MLKFANLTSMALLLSAGYALAGASTMESGRPSAVLTPEQCQQVWGKAVPQGDSLAPADAAPFIVNFQQADADKDNKLSKKEFETGCTKGFVKFTDR
jgi:hypothetical protein